MRRPSHRSPRAPAWGFFGIAVALLVSGLLSASPALACSVCFGSGDPDAAGLAWGVLILLVPVAVVQFTLLRFLVRAARREQRTERLEAASHRQGGL